jgi:hypothetical protein
MSMASSTFFLAESLEKLIEGDGLHPLSRLDDLPNGSETKVQLAPIQTTFDDGAVAVHIGSHLLGTGSGDGARGVISADDPKEVVDVADEEDAPFLLEQFVEQLACVLGDDVPGAIAVLDNAFQLVGSTGADSPGHLPRGSRSPGRMQRQDAGNLVNQRQGLGGVGDGALPSPSASAMPRRRSRGVGGRG